MFSPWLCESSARSTLIMDRIFWYFDEEVNFTPKAVGPSGGAATKLPGKKVSFLTTMRMIMLCNGRACQCLSQSLPLSVWLPLHCLNHLPPRWFLAHPGLSLVTMKTTLKIVKCLSYLIHLSISCGWNIDIGWSWISTPLPVTPMPLLHQLHAMPAVNLYDETIPCIQQCSIAIEKEA